MGPALVTHSLLAEETVPKRPNILFCLADGQSWPHGSEEGGSARRVPGRARSSPGYLRLLLGDLAIRLRFGSDSEHHRRCREDGEHDRRDHERRRPQAGNKRSLGVPLRRRPKTSQLPLLA
jgi:hypothetical protein